MIPVLRPRHPPISAAFKYLQRIDETGRYCNGGLNVKELEVRLSAHYQGASVVAVSSCTAGLEMAYLVARMRGFKVIELPAYTFPATWHSATRAGLKIKAVDVDPKTWISPYVSGFGTPTYAPIVDAAGAFGEQTIPSLGVPPMTAVFSLHGTKPLSAGEGGFIVTWDADEVAEYRRLMNFGIVRAGGPSVAFGFNAKMSEYTAAIALAGLDCWDREPWLKLWDWYDAHLPSCVTRCERPRGVYSLYPVKLPVAAAEVVELMAEAGIECRQWYTPLMTNHPVYANLKLGAGHNGGHKKATVIWPALPVSEDLAEHVIGLPYHLWLSEADVALVCERLGTIVSQLLAMESAT